MHALYSDNARPGGRAGSPAFRHRVGKEGNLLAAAEAEGSLYNAHVKNKYSTFRAEGNLLGESTHFMTVRYPFTLTAHIYIEQILIL